MNLEKQWTTSGLTFSGTYHQTKWESSFSLDLSQLCIDNFYNLSSENHLSFMSVEGFPGFWNYLQANNYAFGLCA